MRQAAAVHVVGAAAGRWSGNDNGREMMSVQPRQFPPLPQIGHPESYYAKQVHLADRVGDRHGHEANKVGQYVTLAMDPHLQWEEKLKYFRHALKRHCVPPPLPDDDVWMFYRSLADLVRQYSGQEALRLASIEDDLYAARINMGQTRDKIEEDAEQFFGRLVPSECPEWFNEEDYAQMRLIRDQWIQSFEGGQLLDRAGSRRIGLELFALSFAALFLELMVIRWAPSVVRLVAYYGNLLLISSFLGLGIGAMLADAKRDLMRAFALLLTVDVTTMILCRHALLPGSQSEVRFYSEAAQQFLNYFVLVSIFVVNAVMFVPLGQRIGRLFKALPPLYAYSWDLGGSLAGTVCFGIFSFTHFSPVLGMSLVAVIVMMLLPQMRARWMHFALLLLCVVAVSQANDPRAQWSPYYYISVHEAGMAKTVDERAASVAAPPASLRTMPDPPAYMVHVNHDYYQPDMTLDLSRYTDRSLIRGWVEWTRYQYDVPYHVAGPRDRVLVIGAGGGADVEVALLNGAKHVDAVEIDPALVALSRKFNASGVYDDARVTVHVDDARAFMRRTQNKYDLLVFGFLDSQTLFSYMSNLRLDGYIYTVQSIRTAYGLLNDDGMLALSFVAAQPWLERKLVRMVAEGTGTTPILYKRAGQIIVCALRGKLPTPLPLTSGHFELSAIPPASELQQVQSPTDSWPFLYLSSMTIPRDYLVVIGTLAVLSLASVLAIRGSRLSSADGHFFLLGAGFLLLETKSITDCSLYFGTTWLVTTVVIAGVLLMVLAANLLAMRMKHSPLWLYAPLLASLLVLYFVPRDAILSLPAAQRFAWTLLAVPLPVFFAGLIFSTTFRDSGAAAAQFFGANLIGAMVGGFCEYLGMAFGNEKLMLLVIAAYAASLLLRILTQSRITPSPAAATA